MTQANKALLNEQPAVTDDDSSGKNHLSCPEQEGVSRIKYLVTKSIKADLLMPDPCTETIKTSKAGTILS